jgi:hypothetical protein
MANRNLTSTFYAPKKIVISNPDTGRMIDADVIDYGTDRIVAAVHGIKVILNLNEKGIFEGKMAGMTLFYDPAKK